MIAKYVFKPILQVTFMIQSINTVFERCTATSAIYLPSAGTLAYLDGHPFLAWCMCHAAEEEKQEARPDSVREILAEAGIKHEAAVVRNDYGEAAVVPITYDTPEKGFKLLLEAAFDGIDVISQVPLMYSPCGFYGIPDILERHDNEPSAFGDWHYVVKEIKSAKKFKDTHYLQAAYYTRALGLIQEYMPPNFLLTDGTGETHKIPFTKYEKLLDEVISRYMVIRDGSVKPAATYGQCNNTEWEDYCNRLAVEAGDISLLSGVGDGALRGLMINAGVTTITDVSTKSTSELCDIRGIGSKKAASLKAHAQAIISNKVVYKDKPLQFPQADNVAYLDFEGFFPAMMPLEMKDGTKIIEPIWMIGMVIEDEFKYYFAGDPYGNTVEKPVQNMMDIFLNDLPENSIIYHWGNYDRASMKRLLQEYRSDRLDVLDSIHDMRKIITASYALPTYSNGIKEVSKWCGFDFAFKHPDADAGNVNTVWMGLMDGSIKDVDTALGPILEYNEADCRMLECVHEKFKNMKE